MKVKEKNLTNRGGEIGKEGFVKDFKWAVRNWPLYVMFIPGFVLTALFAYFPMFGIIIAFKKVRIRDGILGSPWIGFENFEALFRNQSVWDAIRNTVLYNVVFIFTGLIIAVAIAIALNLISNKIMSKVFQTVYIMPHFLSMVIVAYLVYAFLNMESGFLNNQLLPAFQGADAAKVNWYVTPNAWPIILFIVRTWHAFGYSSIVYLAAISGIDMEMYEAADIDGATTWQKIVHITVPSIRSMMIMMTIMNIGGIFNGDFGLFYNVTMNSGALYPTTLVTNTYIYNLMTAAGGASMGMSSAASLLQSVVGFIMVITTNTIVKKIDEDSSMF